MGYVEAAYELLRQADERHMAIDYIVHASGSGGTQAGLLSGFAAQARNIKVLGISVKSGREDMEAKIYNLADQVSTAVNGHTKVCRDHVVSHGWCRSYQL